MAISKSSNSAGRTPTDGSGVTQPISAVSLPLPTGASTEGTLALVKADLEGTVSSGNSSTTPLGVGATYTGTFDDVTNYAFMTISVFSDQASATGGLTFQFSSDGVNVDVSESSDVTASSGRGFAITPRSRFFRIVYVNGAVAQTAFRLSVVYHRAGTGLITKPLSDSINDSNFAQTVRGVLAGKIPAGTYSNITAAVVGASRALDVNVVQNVSATGARTDLGQVFSLAVDVSLATSGVRNPAILLKNPTGSGKRIRIVRLNVHATAADSGIIWRLFVDPTITINGTTQTPVNLNIGGGSNPATVVTIFTLPTVSANGTRFFGYLSGQNSNSTEIVGDAIVVLNPNHNLLITGEPTINAQNSVITLYWEEVV